MLVSGLVVQSWLCKSVLKLQTNRSFRGSVAVTSRDFTTSQVQRRILSNLNPNLWNWRMSSFAASHSIAMQADLHMGVGFVCGKWDSSLLHLHTGIRQRFASPFCGQKIAPRILPTLRPSDSTCTILCYGCFRKILHMDLQPVPILSNAEILCMNKLLTNCAVTSCRTSLRTDHQTEKKVGKHKSKHSDPLQSNESAGGKCLDTCCVSFRPLGWFRVWNPIPLPVASLARTTVVSNKVPTCEKTLASETKTDAVSSNVYIWKQQCIIRER
jgi:hypothetical protein